MRSLLTVAILALTLSTAGCGWHHRHHHACNKADGCPKAQTACKCQCPMSGQAEAPAK